MNFPVVVVVVIALTFAMVLFAVYRGGGTNALRHQVPGLLVIAAGIIAIGAAFLLVSGSGELVVPLGALTAAAAAVVAGIQAASLSKRAATTAPVITMWAVALVLGLAALGAAALWLMR